MVPYFHFYILNTDLSPTQKLIALTIAGFANSHGEMADYPCIDEVARLTGTSKTTVERTISVLEDGGFLRIEQRPTEHGMGYNGFFLVSGHEASHV